MDQSLSTVDEGSLRPTQAMVLLAIGVPFVAAYAIVSFMAPSARLALNLMFLVSPLAASLTLAGLARGTVGRRRAAWLLIAAAAASWTIGQAMWAFYDIRDGFVPRPSPADVGFALTVPLAALGLIGLWRAQGARLFGARAVIEGAVLGLALMVPLWTLVLKPARLVGAEPSILAYGYAVGSVLVMTAALLILPRVSRIDWRRRLLLGGSLCFIAIGNAASLLLATTGGYRIGHPIDLLWIFGYLLLAAFGAFRDRPAPATGWAREAVASPTPVTYAAIVLAVLASWADVARMGHLDSALFAAGVGLVMGLMTLQRLGQIDARNLTDQVAAQATALGHSNERLRLERVRLENAQRVAGLNEWEWSRASGSFRILWPEGDAQTGDGDLLRTIDADDRRMLDHALERLVEGESSGFDLQLRLLAGDGTTRWIRVWSEVPELAHDGDVRGLAQDITVLKEVELARIDKLENDAEVRRLREMDEMRATFINVAAHELNTPLTPIKIQLEILRQSGIAEASPSASRSLDILQRNVNRLANLVVDLLDSGRLQSGRMKFTFAPLDLAELAADVIDSAHATAERAGVSLFFEAHGKLPIKGDGRRVHEILDNLLNNAVKFTPPGGRIDVIAWADGPFASVRVRDQGIGLSKEGLNALFQPFSQVDRPVRREDSGTGLGLFIARGIALAHGGTVEAESQGLGKGSTFVLRIPLEASALVPEALPAPAQEGRLVERAALARD